LAGVTGNHVGEITAATILARGRDGYAAQKSGAGSHCQPEPKTSPAGAAARHRL